MRALSFVCFSVLLLGGGLTTTSPALSASSAKPSGEATAPLAPPETPAARLDRLFSDLKRERNEKAAERIAARIWNEWNHSGSASVDLMMLWAQQALDAKKFDMALDFLDQVVVLKPDYAEGWNRRATVHFAMNNWAKSMADIEQTLSLEPRHFGALAGMAAILKSRDSKQLALDAYGRVLSIYPMLRSAQAELASLSDELAGESL